MLDIIAIGNISADLFFRADTLTQKNGRYNLAIGGKYMVDKFEMHVGGGGANVAIGCRKFGMKSAVVGTIGNNAFRKSILERLHKSKVSTRHTLFNQTDANLSVVLLNEDGERTIIVYESPHRHSTEEKHLMRSLPRSRAVYFGNMPDVAMEYRNLVMARLKKQKTFVAVNVGWQDCCRPKTHTNELLEHADLLIVNTYEFAELVKKKRETVNFSASVFDLIPVMQGKMIVVTDSANGSYCYYGEKVYRQKAIKVKKIVDTTGAGDAFSAGFIATYIKHENIELAMKAAAQNSSHALQRIGAT